MAPVVDLLTRLLPPWPGEPTVVDGGEPELVVSELGRVEVLVSEVVWVEEVLGGELVEEEGNEETV